MLPARLPGALVRAPLLMLLLAATAGFAPAQEGEMQERDIQERGTGQDLQQGHKRRQKKSVGETPPDWDLLSGPLQDLKKALEGSGIDLDVDAALFNQWASDTDRGKSDLLTFSYELDGNWQLFSSDELGTGLLVWSILGSEGLNYSTHGQSMTGNVGSAVPLRNTLQPDPVIVNELLWKQVFDGGRTVLQLGKVDLSSHFDTNRVANSGFTQFQAGAMENSQAIPFPAFGGFGGVLWTRISEQAYLMVGMADSSMDTPVAPWETVDNDSWYQLVEVGFSLDCEHLGKGQYRLTPWHSKLFGDEGWGIAFNCDQELGEDWLVGFFRAGTGDEDVVRVENFLSGGIGIMGLFDRPHDMLGFGASWSDPSPSVGSRSETLVEAFYRFQLSPTLQFTPDVQVVFNPTNGTHDTVLLAGARLNLVF